MFLWFIFAYLYPVEDHKNRTSNYVKYMHTLRTEGLAFPMKFKDIPKIEKMKNRNTEGALRIIVFELAGTVLSPIHINTNYQQPQIDLLLFENHYCLITKLHNLINQHSNMKHRRRRCLTASSSQPVLIDHIERCIKQQLTNVTFSWKDRLKFEDHHMKVFLPIKIYAGFECINQPQDNPNDPKVLFEQIPIAVGYYLIAPFGIKFNSYFGEGCTESQQSCVKWIVNEMLTLEKMHIIISKET